MPTSDRRRKIIEQVEELDVPEQDDDAAPDPGDRETPEEPEDDDGGE